MSRRDNSAAAERAALQASEAGRVLQAQRQPAERSEPAAAAEATPERNLTPRNEPRRQAMEEIEKRHEETSGVKAPKAEPEAPAPKKAEEPPAKAPEAAPEPAAATPEAAPAELAPVIETVRVKVDGEEFDAPKAEVEEAGGIRSYQILKASEKRLKLSNETLAEAKRAAAAVEAWTKQQQAPAKPKQTDDEFIASKMDAIRFGSPADSAAALREVMDRNRVEPTTIVGQAVSAMQQQAAEAQFVKDYADIVHNPILLRTIIGLRDERIRQGNLTGDWQSFYSSLGNEVRSAIGRPHQPASSAAAPVAPSTGSTSQVSTEKEARKASIVTLPTAAARAALPAESKPESREDILNEMRKTRGLPTG